MSNNPTSNLTDEQQLALSAHDRSVSLAAGAGCGKTFVLTERFLSYLDPKQLEPTAELTELVAITFTDAAAREMRARIRRRCHERMHEAADAAERGAWKRLLSTLDGARISTIHSFCATLLRNYAAEAAVDPRFELLDAPTAQLMRLQTMDDHLRQLLVSGDQQLIELATHFGLRNLRGAIVSLLGTDVRASAERWLEVTPEELVAHWREHYETQFAPAALSTLLASEPIQRLREQCASATVTAEKILTRTGEILDLLEGFTASEDSQQAVTQLRALAGVRGVTTAKDWVNEDDYVEYRDTCEAVRTLIDKSIFKKTLAEGPMREAAEFGLKLLKLVAAVDGRFTHAKQQRNMLEFDDLLTRTHALLVDKRYPQVRQSLAKHTRLLMVDEFQDTNPLQVAIVKALRGEQWAEQGLFVVGDFKQSIYRFRGAEPRVSIELRDTLPEEGRLSLTTNFRSQPAIVDFVNALFHDAFAENYQPLRAHRPQRTPTPAVEFLWSMPDAPPPGHKPPKENVSAARAREARYIARRIVELLEDRTPVVVEDTQGTPTTRPLELGDIAILFSALSDVSIYEAALREYGLDYYLAGGSAFYAQQEIRDVLHLLRTIVSPIDELSMAGLLRSPMFALTDETLFWLVQHAGSLQGGLFADPLPEQLSPLEREKTRRAAEIIEQLRGLKDTCLVAELLSRAIAATGYDAMLLTEFLGYRKWANVQKMIEQARALDRTRPGDLHGFVTQLSEFVLSAPKEPLAATRADSEVIRLMSIHNAKGLEFPFVVVPDLQRGKHQSDSTPVFDSTLGPLVPSKQKDKNLVGWDLYRFAEREQEQEERKRLMYVACTRASDYLLLSSSINDLQEPESDWLKLLAEHFDLADGTYIGELPTDYAMPEVHVTLAEPSISRKPVGPTRGADLRKLLTNARQLATAGQGVVPPEVLPIPVDKQARQQFSFSQITGHLQRDDLSLHAEEPTTGTDSSSAATGRSFGNLVHAVLERLDFSQPETDLVGLCEFLAPRYLETDLQENTQEAAQLVTRFLDSPRAAQLRAAKQVLREVELMLPWSPSQQSGADRYLHGYMDCLYQDAQGDWHLLDYKSNHVDAAGVPQLAESYAMQMFVYTLACEQALGVRPVESVLHFLRPGEEVACAWDGGTRQQLTEQINQAIAAQIG